MEKIGGALGCAGVRQSALRFWACAGESGERVVLPHKIGSRAMRQIRRLVAVSVLDQSQWIVMRHRLVGIAALPTLIRNSVVEVSPSVYTNESAVDVARRFFTSVKKEIAIVQDRVGMVLPRVLCQIINEAMFAVQQDVAAPKDIDTAMKLGMNFPSGPIEWGEKIGFKQVVAVLEALYGDLGEERYRICPLLKEIAVTGKFWG